MLSETMYIFEAENIRKTYNNFVALDNVSLKISEGSIYGLLGPNGAGKTSMIRIINQITGPDSGTLKWRGVPMTREHVNNIGYLPEERGLYKKMKVGEHGMYLAQLKGVHPKIAKEKLRFWFEKFDILNWWNKRVEELSKGMQQKVQFILTVIHEPELFIFDEPFSGFDPINTELLKKEILDFKKNGHSIILSTHNMASVEELCDDMLLINQSKPILQGNVNEIKQSFRQNLVEVHFSECIANLSEILPAEFKVKKEKTINAVQKVQIHIPDHQTPNDMLNLILPYCRVHAFFEVLPTLNEIFIRQVKATTCKSSSKMRVDE
jgi:ABC-2 type transport system ATP-binding protein